MITVQANRQHNKCPNGLLFNAPTGRTKMGWKTKENEKEWGPREIETNLSPTQAQLQLLAH